MLMHQIAAFILTPLHWFLFFGLCALAFYLKKMRRLAYFALALCGAWGLVLFVSPLAIALAKDLEARFRPLSSAQIDSIRQAGGPIHLVVLSTGVASDPDIPAMQQLSDTGLRRLAEAVRLHQHLPDARLVTTAVSQDGPLSQAELVARAGMELGFESRDTLMLSGAVNTQTEARAYARRLKDSHATIVLCTSALHMQRALFWFRHYGLEPVPAPADYLVRENPASPSSHWAPSFATKPRILDAVVHEWVGLWYGMWKSGSA